MRVAICILFTFAAALACTQAHAKHMYQYTDEHGIVHFTDVAPNGDVANVKSTLVSTERQPLVRLRESGPDSDRSISFINSSGGPVSVAMEFQEAANVIADPALPTIIVLAAQTETHALQITPQNVKAGYRYRYSYRYMPGDYRATADAKSAYRLPFDAAHEFPVGQAFGGSFSHHDAQNRYAVDIGMPEGTPVQAARDGVVMTVDNDFFGNGLDMAQYGDRANNIRIVHADGAMSVYAHLELESARVHVGQHVRAGQVIALSGDTGFTSGPHLHFCVQVNSDMQLVAVPFQFAAAGATFTPVQGQMLGGD
ncbi:MAG: M23 family metallopeptidase [Rudaea sp.]